MTAQHLSTWTEDEDGFYVVVCSCGFTCPPTPDTESAADMWGDHMWTVGYRAGQDDEARFA